MCLSDNKESKRRDDACRIYLSKLRNMMAEPFAGEEQARFSVPLRTIIKIKFPRFGCFLVSLKGDESKWLL